MVSGPGNVSAILYNKTTLLIPLEEFFGDFDDALSIYSTYFLVLSKAQPKNEKR